MPCYLILDGHRRVLAALALGRHSIAAFTVRGGGLMFHGPVPIALTDLRASRQVIHVDSRYLEILKLTDAGVHLDPILVAEDSGGVPLEEVRLKKSEP